MTDTTFDGSYIATDAILETMIGVDLRVAAVALKALAAASQEWYCQEASRHIDAQPIRGQRYEEAYIYNGTQKDLNSDGLTQTLEFPRIIDGVIVDFDWGTQLPIVPNNVKLACLEEAIAILAAGAGGRRELQEQGVQNFSVGGKLSETFIPGAGTSGLLSDRARRYMRKYIGAETR